MFKFAVLTVAFLLAPGLQTATVLTREVPLSDIIALPATINEGDVAIVPDTRPLPIPETEDVAVEDDILPAENPCTACFSYITELLELLGNAVEIPTVEEPTHPDLPEVESEADEESEDSPWVDIAPHPLPVAPEVEAEAEEETEDSPWVEVAPHPLPVAPEVEDEAEEEADVIIPQVRPLPLPIEWLRSN